MWGRLVKNINEMRLEMKKEQLMKYWEAKKYDKIGKLLKTPADYNTIKFNEYPFVYFLISEGDHEGVKAIFQTISYKEQVLADDANPMAITPINYALLEQKDDIVELLKEHGGSLNKLNGSKQNALHLAAIYKREEAFKKALADRKIDMNVVDQFGNTPFHYAARNGSVEMVATLVAARAKKTANAIYQYPIHMAIESGNIQCVEVLSSDIMSAYPNLSPIHSSARSGNVSIVQKVLQMKPATLNFQDHKGLTALHHSVLVQDQSVAGYLLKQKGIALNLQDQYGNTPLHLAVINESYEMTSMLIQQDADMDLENKDMMSVAEYGMGSTNKSIRSLLLSVSHKSKKIRQLSVPKY